MTELTNVYAKLSKNVYDGNTPVVINGVSYNVLESESSESGFYGVIYQNVDTNEIIVAFCGTEDDDQVRDLLETDGQMLVFDINQQLDDARRLVVRALELAKMYGTEGEAASVTLTGHSLGGSLAQVMSYEYNLYGETVNAFGTAGICGVPSDGVPVGHNIIVNHVRATDIVGLAHDQYGEVREYATIDDLNLILRSAASLPNDFITSVINVTGLGPSSTHSIEYFIGDNTILTDANAARYESYQQVFDFLSCLSSRGADSITKRDASGTRGEPRAVS